MYTKIGRGTQAAHSSILPTHPGSIASNSLAMVSQVCFCISRSSLTQSGTSALHHVSQHAPPQPARTPGATYSPSWHECSSFPWLSTPATTACSSVRLPSSAVRPDRACISLRRWTNSGGAFLARLVTHKPGQTRSMTIPVLSTGINSRARWRTANVSASLLREYLFQHVSSPSNPVKRKSRKLTSSRGPTRQSPQEYPP